MPPSATTKKLTIVFTHPAFDVECRAVQATVDNGLAVASMYVPNGI
jgi:hypothetical protein